MRVEPRGLCDVFAMKAQIRRLRRLAQIRPAAARHGLALSALYGGAVRFLRGEFECSDGNVTELKSKVKNRAKSANVGESFENDAQNTEKV